ncbi:hypothetical protein, partial [Microbulbifer harenosus]
RAFEGLEPYARKPARTVLRGPGVGDGSWLLGASVAMMKDDSYFGRLIIIFMLGPPMLAANLLMEKKVALSMVMFLAWLCLSMYAISYMSRKRIVRKWLSVPVTLVIAACYLSFYASFNA